MNEQEKNPSIVLDAITETSHEFSKFTLNPVTILRYAWLEKLHSPFIDASQEFTIENIAPSVYVLAVDKKELRKYGSNIEELKLDALEWADENLKIDEVAAVIKAIVGLFTALNKAAPQAVADSDPKKN